MSAWNAFGVLLGCAVGYVAGIALVKLIERRWRRWGVCKMVKRESGGLLDVALAVLLAVAYVVVVLAVAYLVVALVVAIACWGLGLTFTWALPVGVCACVAIAALTIRLGVGKRG